MFMRLCSVDKL